MAERKRRRKPRKKKIKAKLKGKVYVGNETEAQMKMKEQLIKQMKSKADSLQKQNDSLMQVVKIRLK